MRIVEKNIGRKIDYALDGTKLSFANGELTLDLARYQKDVPVTRDIMADSEGLLTNGPGQYYIAQVEIPAREYEDAPDVSDEEDDEAEQTERQPLPLDTDKVTLYLFSVEGIYIQ
jgi:hypothetical protein